MKYAMKNLLRLGAILLMTLAFTASIQQTIAQTKKLLALSKTDHILAIVDPATLKTLARIPVGVDPHELITSPDGKTAYVTIYGGGAFHEINVIDLVAQKPLKNLDTRPLYGPHGVVYENGKVWFSAEGSKAVGSYDPAAGIFDWSMGTGQERTHMIFVAPGAKKIYTTNMSSGSVSILTGATFTPPKWWSTARRMDTNPDPGFKRVRRI
jgi:DNA-binding beta-propeller fold protein YncE